MTSKPLSERIREAQEDAVTIRNGLTTNADDVAALLHDTLGFLAELAEMMEKK